MTSPRVVIDLVKLRHNTRALVTQLSPHGISVVGVTKAMCGLPAVGAAMVQGGAVGLGDSRAANLGRLARAGVAGPRTLIRTPMLSEVADVVAFADSSCNTEAEVLRGLSVAAGRAGRSHRVVLMVELGDLREGIMPEDLDGVVRATLSLPNLELEGIGANLACQHGVIPDRVNMGVLDELVHRTEATSGAELGRVSGGNSASLAWASSGADTGRVDELRLGEAILLGREPIERTPIPGLFTDAVTLIGEVIESKWKPSAPWGDSGQNAAGEHTCPDDRGPHRRSIVALGRQDVDPAGLAASGGRVLLGTSSDHMVLDSVDSPDRVGDELSFSMGYGALLSAMTSPYVGVELTGDQRKPDGNPQ